MSAPSTSGLSVELLLRVIDVKYGYFTLLSFTFNETIETASMAPPLLNSGRIVMNNYFSNSFL